MKTLSLFSRRPQPLTLDFRGSGSRRWAWPGLILLALATLLAGWQYACYEELDAEIVRQEEAVSALRRKPTRSVPVAGDKGNADMARQLALPWDGLLRAMEAALGSDVALLSLEADANGVRLAGEALSLEEALAFVQRLSAGAVLVRPELLSHEVKTVEGRQVVGFTVRSGWRAP